MRTLIPMKGHDEGAEAAADALYADLELPGTPALPRVSLGMITSVDGAVAVDGRSGGLGGDADRAAFRALRAACDAILVGAGTVRDEGYGPPRGDPARRAARVARGLAASPRLVVVSGSLALPLNLRVFEDPEHRPVVVTHEAAPADRVRELSTAADVLTAGYTQVDLVAAVEQLGALGIGRILCEGGPRLNGAVLAAGLVEEVFLTLAPALVGGGAPRMVVGDGPGSLRGLELVEAHVHDDELLLRYRRT